MASDPLTFGHYKACSRWMKRGHDCRCYLLDRLQAPYEHDAYQPPLAERIRAAVRLYRESHRGK